MKRPLLLIITLSAFLMGTGFASREWTASSAPPDESERYDMHLKYYEEIRPLLVAGVRKPGSLCNGDSATAFERE